MQSQDDSRGLEQREPAGDRLRVNVGVVCDVRHVEELARPGSHRHEEAVEGGHVAHVDEVAHVTLEVGSLVVCVVGCPVDRSGHDLRHAPPPDSPPDVLGPGNLGRPACAGDVGAPAARVKLLTQGDAREVEDAHAARKRLRDAVHEAVALGTRQNDSAPLV